MTIRVVVARATHGPMLRRGIACFAALLAVASGCSDATGPEREISGERLYNQYCARCHGLDGSGVISTTQNRLNDPRVMANLSDEAVRGIIRAGKPSPTPGQPPLMPAFNDQFTEASLMVLSAYVRSLSQPGRSQQAAPGEQAQP